MPNLDMKQINRLEMKMMSEMFNSLKRSCSEKCIPGYFGKVADLNRGETVCLDRCSSKYLETFQIVGERLGEMTNEIMKQQM